MLGIDRKRHKLRRTRLIKSARLALFGFGLGLGLLVTQTADLDAREKSTLTTLTLSSTHKSYLINAFKEADRRNWAAALNWARKVKGSTAEKIIQWRRYQDDRSGARFEEIVRFIEANPDWPRRTTLLSNAEKAMPSNMSDKKVIAWFAGQEPITGQGKLRLGEAYLSRGKKEFGAFWIRDAWVKNSFPSRDETNILSKHKKLLRKEDHAKRVDRLLWQRQTSAARRLIPYLSKDDAAVANARISLISRGSIGKSISRVPYGKRNDPGLVYEQTRLHRAARRDASAQTILRQAPDMITDESLHSKWWYEREILIRRAIKARRYQDAYELAANHGITRGAGFADGEWIAGWLALRILKNPSMAEGHFRTLENGVSYPISKARAAYWIGRAVEEGGRIRDAGIHYDRAAQYPTTFYGQLAIEKLQANKARLDLREIHTLKANDIARVTSRGIMEAVQLLHLTGQTNTLKVFVFHLANYLDKPEDFAALADLMYRLNHPELGLRAAKKASLKHIFLHDRAYPLNAINQQTINSVKAPIELVLGLSRQESEFNPRAISRAGALGLMQLMPGTAKIVARQVRLPYNKSRLTTDPNYNVMLGSAHLADLLRNFRGSYILTIASYNAGPNRARQWIGDYGDPRTAAIDPIDWIEKIPFNETRNYVQRVMENMQVYRTRLSGSTAPLHLSRDLGTSPPTKPIKVTRRSAPQKPAPSPRPQAQPQTQVATTPAPKPARVTMAPIPNPGDTATSSEPAPVMQLADETPGVEDQIAKLIDRDANNPVVTSVPEPIAEPVKPASPIEPEYNLTYSAASPNPHPKWAKPAVATPVNTQDSPVLTAKDLEVKPVLSNPQPPPSAQIPPAPAATTPQAQEPKPVSKPAPAPQPAAPAPTVSAAKPTPPKPTPSPPAQPAKPVSPKPKTVSSTPVPDDAVANPAQGCKIWIPDSTGGGTCADLPEN